MLQNTLTKISPRTFSLRGVGVYKWLKHEKTDEEKENEQIARLVREYDERFNHTLGYRRMTGYMNRLNRKEYGEKRIYRIMKMMGIRSVIRKKAK